MCNPEISYYQLTSIVSECCGGTAVVYSAFCKSNCQNVAIKRYFVDKSKENANLIQQEIQTTKELKHPNILPYLTSFVHGRELYVVSPLMTLGSCRDILNSDFQDGLPELACAMILREVLQALDYLHKQLYIHRGVRASHILLSSCGAVRLSGLRSAGSLMVRGRRQKQLHSLPPPNHDNSNLIWLSPELLEQNLKGYDEKSDIYSVGVVTCELANGVVPFCKVGSTLMLTEKVRGARPQLLDCSTFPHPAPELQCGDSPLKDMYNPESGVGVGDGPSQSYATKKYSEPFHNFNDICLYKDPEKRPSAVQLLSHSFFKQIRKTDFLPSLIGRVKPIRPKPDDMGAFLLDERLSEMEIDKSTEWDF